jgi:hypothetical protein
MRVLKHTIYFGFFLKYILVAFSSFIFRRRGRPAQTLPELEQLV